MHRRCGDASHGKRSVQEELLDARICGSDTGWNVIVGPGGVVEAFSNPFGVEAAGEFAFPGFAPRADLLHPLQGAFARTAVALRENDAA